VLEWKTHKPSGLTEGHVDATAQVNRSVDAGGGYTIGAWKESFEDVAVDLVADLKVNITGVKQSFQGHDDDYE
jgi:hypothetical protein